MQDATSLEERLYAEVTSLKLEIEREKRIKAKREEASESLESVRNSIKLLDKMILRYNSFLTDIEDYISFRAGGLTSGIQMAIAKTRSIIPQCEKIVAQTHQGDFWLETESGRLFSQYEGGGARSLISLFLREVVLANTGYVKSLILDEAVAEVNNINTAELSKYLNVLAEDLQIILIEHKPEILANIDSCLRIEISKIEGVSKASTTYRREKDA